jgi:hypothetical protein
VKTQGNTTIPFDNSCEAFPSRAFSYCPWPKQPPASASTFALSRGRMGAVASATSSEQALFCYRCQQTKYTARLPRAAGSAPTYSCPTCSSDFVQVAACRLPVPRRSPSRARVCQCASRHARVYLTLCYQLVEDDSNVRLSRPRVSAQSDGQAREQLHGGGAGRIRVAVRAAAGADDAADAAGFSRALTPLFPYLSPNVCVTRREQGLPCRSRPLPPTRAFGSPSYLPVASNRLKVRFRCCLPCKLCVANYR